MGEEAKPAWLVRQEHGILAEARTRAFLLERFWILERSVDIEGADFMIQRRLTNRSLLDRNAPRLGYVQSKFYGDSRTHHYIHKEYVLDPEGRPRQEFFLLAHSGCEESAELFLLSASEISNNFQIAPDTHSMAGRYVLTGKTVLASRFRVVDIVCALDRVERALESADFMMNRWFLSWALPLTEREQPPITDLYNIPISNWWGDIPDGFHSLREASKKARWELESIVEQLSKIESCDDPEAALLIAEGLCSDYPEEIRINCKIWNDDFWNVVRRHKQIAKRLDEEGLVDVYSSMKKAIHSFVVDDLANMMPMEHSNAYVLTVSYNPETWLQLHSKSKLDSMDSISLIRESKSSERSKYCAILSTEPGKISAYLLAGRFAYNEIKEGELVETKGAWSYRVQDVVEMLVSEVMDEVLRQRFAEELEV